MAFVPYALLLLQLSMLLSSTVSGEAPAEAPHHHHQHHHHHAPAPAPSPVKHTGHPPIKSPTKPPVHPPVKTPVHPPVKPPSYPPMKPPHMPPHVRKMLAVQGVVYCKPCQYKGVNTLMKATPLAGSMVKLQCNNTKHGMMEQTMTDKNGYFMFTPRKVTTMASHKCKVFLVSSPMAKCNLPTNLNGGAAGAMLIPDPKPPVGMSMYQFFNVGPFAFDSPKKCY